MPDIVPLEPVDYLVIGHVARDLTPQGPQLGGTVAYSALTARALGLRVGIVTAAGDDVSLEPLKGIPVVSIESISSTTFENIYTDMDACNTCARKPRALTSTACLKHGATLLNHSYRSDCR